ncbi:TetR/AcrR family transcriptional regulator [Peptoniphilus sp. SGI.035]|uniref:TetR/AcrR family transcriptional regulator n=1 Tax=Peptoniphilus sp. SGI.035 TaxID=3420564 RepID=UPI003D0032FB
MTLPDYSIDSKILDSAKKEFLAKGYVDASLREICKNAGVTTGALYNRFSGKESLFKAVLDPTLKDIDAIYSNVENFNYEKLNLNEMSSVWNMSEKTLVGFMEFIYAHYDGFKLLLCRSEGSMYSNFLNDFVEEHTKKTMRFIKIAFKKGIVQEHIDEDEVHMLLTAFWSTMFEPVMHDLNKERAMYHCKAVSKLFNWEAVLGF